jgi:hypothetical protein
MEPGIGFLPRTNKMIRKGRVYRLKYEEDKDMPFPHVKKLSPRPLVLALEEERVQEGIALVKVLYEGKVIRVPVWHLYDPYEGGLGE